MLFVATTLGRQIWDVVQTILLVCYRKHAANKKKWMETPLECLKNTLITHTLVAWLSKHPSNPHQKYQNVILIVRKIMNNSVDIPRD